MTSLLVLNRVYILEMQSVMLVFVRLCELLHLNPFLWLGLLPPPFKLVYCIPYTYTVCGGEGGVDYWVKGGRGPQTDKTPAAKSLYRSIFFITTFGIAFYQSNLSTGKCNSNGFSHQDNNQKKKTEWRFKEMIFVRQQFSPWFNALVWWGGWICCFLFTTPKQKCGEVSFLFRPLEHKTLT